MFAVTSVSQRIAPRTALPSPINENALRAHIKFLADDRLEGRGTGARGGELAALYCAQQFEAMGLKSAGAKGSFFQPVSLVGVKADPKTELRIEGTDGSQTFKFGDDFVAFTGAQTEHINAKADLVFVGYGIDAPEQKWNDYKLPADDYRGKILVMLVNDPPATREEPELFGGRRLTYYGRWTYKYEEAARRGAVGAILLHTSESAGYPWSVVRTSNGSWRFDIARSSGDKTPFLQFRSWMTDEAGRRMLRLAGLNLDVLRKDAATRDFRPIKLNLKASLDLNSEVKRVEAPNVVAILPGRDPKLRDEYVVYSAHWDHFGVGAPVNGDRIYHGAKDNAIGTAGLLEIARAFTRLPSPPKRAILFLAVTAEEQGLLGSQYYSVMPIYPLAKTVANINMDGLNVHGRTRDVTLIGYGASDLDDYVRDAAAEQGRVVRSDPEPEKGFYYRSDHFNFAKQGVPALDPDEGIEFVGKPPDYGKKVRDDYTEHDYHQPSDVVKPDWDLSGAREDLKLFFAVGYRIAQADKFPEWKPGNEFRSKREEMLRRKT